MPKPGSNAGWTTKVDQDYDAAGNLTSIKPHLVDGTLVMLMGNAPAKEEHLGEQGRMASVNLGPL